MGPDIATDRTVLVLTRAPADLARLYPWLEAAVTPHRLPAAMLLSMHVALEEAVANVVLHGFAPGDPGEIAIALHRDGDELALTVEDCGRAFDPSTTIAPPRARNLAEAQPGGLGLGLMRHYCSRIGYERTDGRNRLTLRFAVAGVVAISR